MYSALLLLGRMGLFYKYEDFIAALWCSYYKGMVWASRMKGGLRSKEEFVMAWAGYRGVGYK